MHHIALLLLGLSWLQPDHFMPWMSWHSEVLAFGSVLLLAWHGVLVAARRDASERIAFPIAALPLLGLGVIIWGQWASGLLPFFGDALVFSAYLLLCLGGLLLGYNGKKDQSSNLSALAITLMVGAIFSVIVALTQVFDVWEGCAWINRMQFLDRPGGNLGQPNQLATLLLMGLVSGLYIYESRKLGGIPSTLIAFTLIVGVVATGSRAGVLSFAVLVSWWLVKRKSIAGRLSPWYAALVGLWLLFALWFWPKVVAVVLQNPGSENVVNAVAYNRLIIWPQLLEAVRLHPWLGWGFGQVSTAHNAVIDHYPISEPYTFAHNMVLDLALGIGLPLTLLLVLATGVWLWRRARGACTREAWYCLAVAVPVAVHSMLEFPFAYAYFLAPVVFAFGILESQLSTQPAFQIRPKPLILGLSVATVVLLWSVVEYVAVEEDFRVVRFEALHIGETPSDYERPNVRLLTQLDALLYAGRITPRPGMPQEEIELARKVALHYPWLATQNRYALSLALNGSPSEAIRQLQVIRSQRGENTYRKVKEAWAQQAAQRYPQLNAIELP